MSGCPFNHNALKSEARAAIINDKVNACPMAVRLAWHASGTYNKYDQTGGSDGATMRFAPEGTDPANAGLSIIQDLLKPIKHNHPDLSIADSWVMAGAAAVEFTGGPKVPVSLTRSDDADGSKCPANGRLPDAAQGAAHLREVFYRMGFNDQEIVVLSGAHTLGRCHLSRSGFDGPWTSKPLNFDNEYFRNLMNLEWQERVLPNGQKQFQDTKTGKLMMLPTDMALKTDPEFVKFTTLYAQNEALFFEHFSKAFAKLLALGTHPAPTPPSDARTHASSMFREMAMHGSEDEVREWAKTADVHEVELSSGRTALHKAAFWGHSHLISFLVKDCGINVNAVDKSGDTAMHDAARLGHEDVVRMLLAAGADARLSNRDGRDVVGVAEQYEKAEMVQLLRQHLESL